MSPSPDWDKVSRNDVIRAIQEYDRLEPDQFFAQHGFAPATTYQLILNDRSYPPKGCARAVTLQRSRQGSCHDHRLTVQIGSSATR